MSELPPGLYVDGSSVLIDAACEGGTLDGQFLSGFDVGAEGILPDDSAVLIAVEGATGRYEAVEVVSQWPLQEPTFESARQFAKALERTWHVEEYRFNRIQRVKWSTSKVHVYRFCAGWRFDAERKGPSYHVVRGEALGYGEDGLSVGGEMTEWQRLCAQIDNACDSFNKVAKLVAEGGVAPIVDGPLAAVAVNRAEAHRLALLGAELESVVDPQSDLDSTVQKVHEQLEGIQHSVLEALRMLSEVQLQLPDVFPSSVVVDGELDMKAMFKAVAELERDSADGQSTTPRGREG